METHDAQTPDSPSKNSYIGSYYLPPDPMAAPAGPQDPPALLDPPASSPQMCSAASDLRSLAVVNAMKNLQRKINQMELEKKEAEANCQLLRNVTNRPEVSSPSVAPGPSPANHSGEEYNLKLQSVEARCKILEKQLNSMRKMVENGNKERKAVTERQSLQQNQQPSTSDIRTQHEKLERLESECVKLNRTQALAETKLAILEEKLLKERHARVLVQEKADQLQRELDTSLHLSAQITAEEKKAKKTKNTKKSPPQDQVVLPSGPKHKKMPFVAGKSTSPSHSVHANIQSILHMMKHHQPWLCDQIRARHRPLGGIRKNLDKEFSADVSHKAPREQNWPGTDEPLGSLSDLLLALQDELGQMSFEHRELVGQLDATRHRDEREDLKRELESLVTRMEEKGAQITKLRKHWQKVQDLTQGRRGHEGRPVPSPVKLKQKGKSSGPAENNLQLLRETYKFRNNLKRDDIHWET